MNWECWGTDIEHSYELKKQNKKKLICDLNESKNRLQQKGNVKGKTILCLSHFKYFLLL